MDQQDGESKEDEVICEVIVVWKIEEPVPE